MSYEINKPENNSEIPLVTEWKCYDKVVSVLGKEAAEYELNIVRDFYIDDEYFNITNTKNNLCSAFVWYYTPQGSDFWLSVDNEELPDKYKPVSNIKKLYLKICNKITSFLNKQNPFIRKDV